MNLTREEKHELYTCISCRIGIVETGDPSIRARDAVKMGKQHMVRALTTEQMKLVIMLEDLMMRMLE